MPDPVVIGSSEDVAATAIRAAAPVPPPASDPETEDLRGTLRLVDDILNCSDPDRAIPGAQQVIRRALKDSADAAVYPDLVRVVLEAVASDPEAVERIGRAMYEIQRGALGIPATFEQIGEGGREGWRKKAREALLNTTDDKEAPNNA